MKHADRCDDLGSNIYYSAGPVLTQNAQNTASDYMDILGSQVHPVVQVLFSNNAAIFKDNNLPIHIVRTVQSWFEEHEDSLQHLLWLAQSPNLNIIKTVWSIGESRVRSRFSPSFLKQLEEWNSIPLETIHILRVYSKKDTTRVICKWWPNSILTFLCVSFTAVSIIFVHPLYMLPNYIPWGD